MVDVVFSVLRLFVAFLLVFLNGFFVAAEFALVRLRPASVERLVEEGKSGAPLVAEETENLDDYLAVCQLGITLSSLGLGWIGEPAVAALIDPILAPILPESAIHFAAVALGFGFITFLHVVFGELAPKTLAIQEAERISLVVAAPMKFFYYLFVPGIILFNGTANFFTRLVGVSPASETDETHSEEEILTIVARSGEEGDVEMEEVEMIEAVFDLGDTTAREVMIPRPDVVTVPATMSVADLRRVAVEENFTRYPVLDEENNDEAVGFVHAKDILKASETAERPESLTARDLAREIVVVPENRRIDDVLTEFRRRNVHMAVVIDEWGAIEGIVTIEDVLEELVGEIQDEFDIEAQEPSIEELDGGGYAIDGSVSLRRVNEALGTTFESDDFDTVGGVVLSRLGRAPEVGDRIDVGGYSLHVDAVEGTRIATVVVRENARRDELTD